MARVECNNAAAHSHLTSVGYKHSRKNGIDDYAVGDHYIVILADGRACLCVPISNLRGRSIGKSILDLKESWARA